MSKITKALLVLIFVTGMGFPFFAAKSQAATIEYRVTNLSENMDIFVVPQTRTTFPQGLEDLMKAAENDIQCALRMVLLLNYTFAKGMNEDEELADNSLKLLSHIAFNPMLMKQKHQRRNAPKSGTLYGIPNGKYCVLFVHKSYFDDGTYYYKFFVEEFEIVNQRGVSININANKETSFLFIK